MRVYAWAMLLLMMCAVGAGPAAPAGTVRTSRAVFTPEGEVAPTLEIRGTHVTVRHEVKGSGQVRGTALRGKRTYNFPKDGTYQVEPGRYQHLVYGQVPAGGAIVSLLRYE